MKLVTMVVRVCWRGVGLAALLKDIWRRDRTRWRLKRVFWCATWMLKYRAIYGYTQKKRF